MIAIIDYGIGNLGSILNMLKKVGSEAEITSDPDRIRSASKLIFPGVGAFDSGMRELEQRNLIPLLNEQVLERRKPILGICLGMQLMTRGSEEGLRPGLGWVDADTIRFKPDATLGLKVPHMGWNQVSSAKDSILLAGSDPEVRFYFVHSYFVCCKSRDDILLTATHGTPFHAAFERGNIAGVQFHPEKSHKYGLWLLKNFAERF
jgi:imidazole glycerol-phosphate synthase subunit HisH